LCPERLPFQFLRLGSKARLGSVHLRLTETEVNIVFSGVGALILAPLSWDARRVARRPERVSSLQGGGHGTEGSLTDVSRGLVTFSKTMHLYLSLLTASQRSFLSRSGPCSLPWLASELKCTVLNIRMMLPWSEQYGMTSMLHSPRRLLLILLMMLKRMWYVLLNVLCLSYGILLMLLYLMLLRLV